MMLSAAIILLAGCVATPPRAPAPVAVPLHEETWELAARGWDELNMRIVAGDAIAFSFTATTPVSWDLHSHDGSAVRVHANGTGQSGEGTLVAPADGVYSFFAEARQPSSVRVRAEGDFEVVP